jgi:hypothetical protein
MVLKGQRRKAASAISHEATLNRIAKTTPFTTPAPTGGIESSAYQLGTAISAIHQHIGRVAGQHNVKLHDILDELYRRIEGRHR